MKKIEEGIKQVKKMYLQHGVKITCIHADIEFEYLWAEMADLCISLNCVSKKNHVPNIKQLNWTVK